MRVLTGLLLLTLSLLPLPALVSSAGPAAPGTAATIGAEGVVTPGPALGSVMCSFWRWADPGRYYAVCRGR